jgi:hypothetical protein
VLSPPHRRAALRWWLGDGTRLAYSRGMSSRTVPALRGLAIPLLAVTGGACGPSSPPPRATTFVAAGSLAGPAAAPAVPAGAHAHRAGPAGEPLILGPALVTAAGLGAPTAVWVGADGNYRVRVSVERDAAGERGDSVVVVDAERGTVVPGALPAGGDGAGGAPRPAVDAQGRVYTADAASGTVHVLDPAEGGTASRPLLANLAEPVAVAVDTRRGRLLVAERRGGRLRVYELP